LSLQPILPKNRFVEFDIEDYLKENAMVEVPHEEAAYDRTSEEMPA
jgi:hypothetical protein